MSKKRLWKYVGFVVLCLILFPIAPLIIGTFVVYRITKSAFPKNKKWILAILTIVVSFFLTGKVVEALPEPAKTPTPSPTSTSTLAPEVESESIQNLSESALPAPTLTPDPNIKAAKVVNVVDGDTFKIESGETVRMIGIDTPETVHPSKPVQCFGKEASLKNQELIEGKEVKLEKDVSETDRYGRLLRYVYVGEIFVNELLVREGYAMSSSYPPDVKYQDRFVEAQKKAQEEGKGLWNLSICPISTPKSIVTSKPSTPRPTAKASATISDNESFTCNCSKTCAQMSSCVEAQYQLNVCGCLKRDGDGDGIACDADCQ